MDFHQTWQEYNLAGYLQMINFWGWSVSVKVNKNMEKHKFSQICPQITGLERHICTQIDLWKLQIT